MSEYSCICPNCNIEHVKFIFHEKNGYVAFCDYCESLLYYCSMFEKVTYFKPTGEEIPLPFDDLNYIPKEGTAQ